MAKNTFVGIGYLDKKCNIHSVLTKVGGNFNLAFMPMHLQTNMEKVQSKAEKAGLTLTHNKKNSAYETTFKAKNLAEAYAKAWKFSEKLFKIEIVEFGFEAGNKRLLISSYTPPKNSDVSLETKKDGVFFTLEFLNNLNQSGLLASPQRLREGADYLNCDLKPGAAAKITDSCEKIAALYFH